MSKLRILRAGPTVTFQDLGRTGFLRLGVSESGPMDWVSHRLANRVLDNPSQAAVIEFGLGGLEAEALNGPVNFAAVGPDIRVTLDGVTGRDSLRATLEPGQQLTLATGPGALWGYLALGGGAGAEPVMGSRATNRRTGLGPPIIEAGMEIAARDAAAAISNERYAHPFSGGEQRPFRVIKGPQDGMFAPDQLDAFTGRIWKISQRIDRMGYRLDGEPLSHKNGADIVSDGIVMGAIQVPGDGLPTVLMADRQPTGGYPKIATMARADLARLAQCPPGSPVRLSWCTTEEAVHRLRQLNGMIARPNTLARHGLTSEDLLSVNLISGAVAQNF